MWHKAIDHVKVRSKPEKCYYFSFQPSNSIWREDSKTDDLKQQTKEPGTTQNRYNIKKKTVHVATCFNIATKSWVEFFHFFFFSSNTLFSQSRNNYLVRKSLDTSYHETNLIKVILCERENKLSWTEHQKNLTYKMRKVSLCTQDCCTIY